MKESPLVSIVIVGMNVKKFLPACLRSIAELDYPAGRIETIYVDNASSDGSAACVRECHPAARVIENPRNLGFSEGNNVGLRVARGEYLVLLNSDAELHRDWMRHMLACFEGDPAVGIAGCKIYYGRTTTLQHAGGFYDIHARPGHYGVYEEDRGQYETQREVGYVTAAAIMLSRRCLDRIGLFDPHYFIYFEETDWAEAAKRAGFKIMYVPKAIAYHHEMSYTGGRTARFHYLESRNRYRFLVKYFGVRFTLATFRKDLRERRAGDPRVPWRVRILCRALLWNLVHLPETIMCRGRVFR